MKNQMNKEGAAAAELALKAHALKSMPEMVADMNNRDGMMEQIGGFVDLTEAPEDAVSSLVTDLLHYCERERIDWKQDVIARAWQHFRSERRGPGER